MLLKLILFLIIVAIIFWLASFVRKLPVKVTEVEDNEQEAYSGFDFHCLGCRHMTKPPGEEPCKECSEQDKYDVDEKYEGE